MRLNTVEKHYWDDYWDEMVEKPSVCVDVIDYNKLDSWLEVDQSEELILDVGAGVDGKLSKLFRNKGAKVISLDLCEQPLLVNCGSCKIRADGMEISLKNQSINGLICCNLFNTGMMYDRAKLWRMLNEFGRVLKVGGYMIESNYGDTRESLGGFTRKDQEWVAKISGFELLAYLANDNLISSLEKRGVYEGGAYIARKRVYNVNS